jgi:hypothetical protein
LASIATRTQDKCSPNGKNPRESGHLLMLGVDRHLRQRLATVF